MNTREGEENISLLGDLLPHHTKSDLYHFLALTYLLLGCGLTALSIYEDFSSMFGNDISSSSELLSHIGNISNGMFWFPVIAYYLERGVEHMISGRVSEENIERLTRIIPFVICTLFFLYNFDAETAQLLPFSFGTPDAKDIPAGLFGMICGSFVYEQWLLGLKNKNTYSENTPEE